MFNSFGAAVSAVKAETYRGYAPCQCDGTGTWLYGAPVGAQRKARLASRWDGPIWQVVNLGRGGRIDNPRASRLYEAVYGHSWPWIVQ